MSGINFVIVVAVEVLLFCIAVKDLMSSRLTEVDYFGRVSLVKVIELVVLIILVNTTTLPNGWLPFCLALLASAIYLVMVFLLAVYNEDVPIFIVAGFFGCLIVIITNIGAAFVLAFQGMNL